MEFISGAFVLQTLGRRGPAAVRVSPFYSAASDWWINVSAVPLFAGPGGIGPLYKGRIFFSLMSRRRGITIHIMNKL